VANPFHNFANVRYDAVSEIPRDLDDAIRQSPLTYPNSIREAYLQLPELDPRIPALARQIAAAEPTPLDKARAIEQYLPANYAYTLDLSGPAPADPLAYFLFERRAGHCEYFASVMTIMLRSLGIPARYVSGFHGGDYNDVGGDYIIRERHAHSWVEAYFPGYGWLTFDPTPPAADRPTSLLTRLSYYWDWIDLQWGEWVVNYDFARQDSLVQNVRSASRDWTARMQTEIESARNAGTERLRRLQDGILSAPLWIPLSFAILIALALCLRNPSVREWLALSWRLRASRGPLPPHAAALSYRHMLRLLERRGWTKSPAQTPLEFAACLPTGNLAAPVTHLTQMYQATRFGGHPADAGKLASLLAEVQAALRARPPAR
jgi:protein-glutamine gamma-glutamyltransferase